MGVGCAQEAIYVQSNQAYGQARKYLYNQKRTTENEEEKPCKDEA